MRKPFVEFKTSNGHVPSGCRKRTNTAALVAYDDITAEAKAKAKVLDEGKAWD